jgi:hypothetical protein
MTFLIISVIVFNLTAIMIPKRLTKIEMLATSALASILQDNVDIFLDLKLDLYGYFNVGPDYGALIAIFGIYPAANIIILNYFPKGLKSRLLYILAWSVFLTAFEWASVKSGYFYHHGWKYWHSFVCYLVILPILYWCLLFVRKLIGRQNSLSMNEQCKDRLIKKTFTRALFVGYVNKIRGKRKARD